MKQYTNMSDPDNQKKKYQPPKDIRPKHEDLMLNIGVKLAELRKMKNISSSGLAREVGISRNAYHQMESGKVYFNVISLLNVLEYHKISATDFFNDL
jgi:DNA-binding XRE family transcriptional regulator